MISDVFWRKQVITVYVISIAVAQTEKALERLLIEQELGKFPLFTSISNGEKM